MEAWQAQGKEPPAQLPHRNIIPIRPSLPAGAARAPGALMGVNPPALARSSVVQVTVVAHLPASPTIGPIMQASQIARYRAWLEERKSALVEAVDTRLHTHGLDRHADAALPRRAEDTDDDAVASQQRDTDVAQLAGAGRELVAIEAALASIDDGSYGTCAECGDEIPPARLDANPEATRCTRCQQARERHAVEHKA